MLKHGINVTEDDGIRSSNATPAYGVTVVTGTAPVHLLDDPSGAVNVPVITKEYGEAVEKLGYSTAFDKYTLCQMMKLMEDFELTPVVFINVLDPAKHTKNFDTMELSVKDRQAVLAKEGVLAGELEIMDIAGAKMVRDRDYILGRNGETVIITLIGETAAEAETIKAKGKYVDPSLVEDGDIIGGYDADSGKMSGLELIRRVYPATGYTPSLLIAPGYSHHPAVAAVMESKYEEINGCFRCEGIVDIDTETCKKFDDVAKAKERLGVFSRHTYAVWPMVKKDGLIFYGSAIAAAVTQRMDQENDGIVSQSPSNRLAGIDAAVLSDGTEVLPDFVEADVVNEAGVACFINVNGWRLWGNATAAYPDDDNKKAKFWSVRRFFTWRANKFITDHITKVDQNADKRLMDSICDEENLRCNALVSMGVCAAASIRFLGTDEDGNFMFIQSYAPYTPTGTITNILTLDNESIQNTLTGGES